MLSAMKESAPVVSIPRLRTDRLLLREFQTSDFEAYATHMADAEANQFTNGAVDRRMAWRLITSSVGQWMLTGSGWWAMELTATGETVGTVGAFFRETQFASPKEHIELGWSIYRTHWRRGLASEAARAVLAYAFETHDVPRAIAYVAPENVASIGVTRAIGMQYDGVAEFYGEPTTRYAIQQRN